MTETVIPASSHDAPAGRPQPIAFHGGKLWVGCWDTSRLYAIDPATWVVSEEVELPGKPYGLASFDGAIRVVVSLNEADDRFIYRFTPGTKFSEEGRMTCPELTGSHLTTDGKALYLVQQTYGRLLELDAAGACTRTIELSTRCAGCAFDGSTFYLITADDEFDVLELATLDLSAGAAEPHVLAPIHVNARGLAFDGKTWWTAYREENKIVSFAMPGR